MDYTDLVQEALSQLPAGAFLVSGDEANPMTIGWGQFGVVWGKPMLTVLVRHSRYSEKLLRQNGNFTVSFPAPGTMQEALMLCGTRSGRDTDKADKFGVDLQALAAEGNNAVDLGGAVLKIGVDRGEAENAVVYDAGKPGVDGNDLARNGRGGEQNDLALRIAVQKRLHGGQLAVLLHRYAVVIADGVDRFCDYIIGERVAMEVDNFHAWSFFLGDQSLIRAL